MPTQYLGAQNKNKKGGGIDTSPFSDIGILNIHYMNGLNLIFFNQFL